MWVRGVVLALGSVALVVTGVPPTKATASFALTMQGTMTLSGGWGYPCFGAGAPDGSKCPSVGESTTVAGVGGTTVTVPTGIGGNTRGFGLGSNVCLAAGTRPGVTPVAGPSCVFIATGAVTGGCGLSAAQGWYGLWADDLLGTPSYPPVASGHFHWLAVGGYLVVTGNVAGSTTGTLIGRINVVANPDTSNLPAIRNVCLAKDVQFLSLAGDIALVGV